MNTSALTPSAPLDPELSVLARFLRFFPPAAPVLATSVLVRIARNGRGGWSLYPGNPAARALLCVAGAGDTLGETGNFATPADAARRAQWNAWDIAAEAAAVPGFDPVPSSGIGNPKPETSQPETQL